MEHGAGENPFNTNAETSKISDEQSRQTIQPPLDEEQPFVSPTDLRKLPAHIHPNSKEVYPMFSKPRGIALIINIEIFFHNPEKTKKEEENEQCSNRQGSDKDIKMLEKLFGALDFKVKIERNLKREEIFKVLDNISYEDHSNYDCFVLCLMSHGSEGFVYGADGGRVLLENVRDFFSNSRCITLQGKPKLFVIQASRGHDIDKGAVKAGNPVTEGDISIPQISTKGTPKLLNVIQASRGNDKDKGVVNAGNPLTEVDISIPQISTKGKPKLFVIQASRGNDKDKGVVNGNLVTEVDISIPQIIPDQADMLMAYSTVSGYASFRNPRDGSRFVRCLVEVFREKAGHEDVLSMLTMVNDSISSIGEVDSKQVGQPTSTLTKKLFFWPGL